MKNVIAQAKDSLKLLELLEQSTIETAKKLAKIPGKSARRAMTAEKVVSSLRKMGIASQEEVNSLLLRIEKLESKLAQMDSKPKSGGEEIPN